MKYTKICPECGGAEIYAKSVEVIGGRVPDLLPGIGGFMDNIFQRKYLEMYVCGKCGCVRFFAPEKFLAEIREKYQRMA